MCFYGLIDVKVMPTEDLYGHISMATREWKDGLLSSIMRDLGRINNENPKWMILDGDLDANWIESINSVSTTAAFNPESPTFTYIRKRENLSIYMHTYTYR